MISQNNANRDCFQILWTKTTVMSAGNRGSANSRRCKKYENQANKAKQIMAVAAEESTNENLGIVPQNGDGKKLSKVYILACWQEAFFARNQLCDGPNVVTIFWLLSSLRCQTQGQAV